MDKSLKTYDTWLALKKEKSMRYKSLSLNIAKQLLQGKKIAVWPSNEVTTELFRQFKTQPRDGVALLDISKEKHGIKWPCTEIKVQCPNNINVLDYDYYYLCSPNHNNSIKSCLMQQGIKEDAITDCCR